MLNQKYYVSNSVTALAIKLLKCGKANEELNSDFYLFKLYLKCLIFLDFPGGPVIKNLPDNAEDMGSIPGLRRCHIPQLLSLLSIACASEQKSLLQWEALAPQPESSPHLPD